MRIRAGILISVLIMLFSLCSCDKKEVFTLSAFTQNVSVKAEDTEFSGVLHLDDDGSITFEITNPAEISGMKYSLCEGNKSVSFGDMNVALTSNNGCIFTLLDIIRHFAASSHEVNSEGECILSAMVDGRNYELILNCDTRKVSSVQSGEYNYTFK